jgi:hypothetical protein
MVSVTGAKRLLTNDTSGNGKCTKSIQCIADHKINSNFRMNEFPSFELGIVI